MEYFDKKANEWDTDPSKIECARAVAAAIRGSVPLTPDIMALEYGCGTGLVSFGLQPYLPHITLADSSAGMLEVLKEKIEFNRIGNMTPIKLDLATDPLPAERYDLIYTSMTLHHIPDTEKILKEFYALLKTSGFLCIADLDKEDGSFHASFPDFTGHNGFDLPELTKKLEKAGFRNLNIAIVHQIIKETTSKNGTTTKSFPVFLIVAAKP
jgi:ubiquinone/menaquinone biosynthesis C-methylase UbiE